MGDKKGYKCIECGKTLIIENNKTPKCCDKTMHEVPLDICTQPAHAEHSRPMDEEDACDDFRSGK
jgi:hypothetical protein